MTTLATTAADQYRAAREQAEAEASLRDARDIFLQIVSAISDEMADTAGSLAESILGHLRMAGTFGYRESEVRVGEARDMLTAARGLAGDLIRRFGSGSPLAAVAEGAVHELEDHLARLERADLELRTGAAAP